MQADSVFSGISTFGRLPYFPCLASDDEKYDIAFIGTQDQRVFPAQLHITTLAKLKDRRPLRHRHFLQTRSPLRTQRHQTRFSPPQSVVCTYYIKLTMVDRNRKGSRKVRFSGGYNVPLDANPFNSWATVLDCGDIPVTS